MSQPRYRVVALPGGWIVAMTTATGRSIAVSDHAVRESAAREADRLNAAWIAAEARRRNPQQESAITARLARMRQRIADLAAA